MFLCAVRVRGFGGRLRLPSPGRHHAVVQRILREIVRVVHHLALRRLRVFHPQEGDGEGDFRVGRANAERRVARLNGLTTAHVVPRHMEGEQVAELSRLVLRLRIERRSLIEVRHGFHQVPRLVLVQNPARANPAGAARAKSLHVGAPDGATLVTGDQRVVNSLVFLGFGGGKDEHFGFNGVDGEHAWKAWSATTFLLRFAGYSLAHFLFQFFIEFDGFQGGEGGSPLA